MRTIKDIGEFGLIELIRKRLRHTKGVIKGIGDDSAVISQFPGKLQLLTTDTLVENIDFKMKEASPEQVGRKLLSVNLSDIAAMGGVPKYSLLTLGLPAKTSMSWLNRFLKGFLSLSARYKVKLIGGDLSNSGTLWTSLVLIGMIERKNCVYRCGARPGDDIFVTGSLGGSILGKHFDFKPRLNEAREIIKRFHPTSMIDISDGLIQDLRHIMEESAVGADVFASAIPISDAARKLSRIDKRTALMHAMTDGEDFELIFTAKSSSVKSIPKKIAGIRISRIGTIHNNNRELSLFDSEEKKKKFLLSKSGYKHF